MPCYHPITAYRSARLSENGKRKLVFNKNLALNPDEIIQVPCGQCIGCRLEYARTWALRCWHESTLYPNNHFITLTYDDDHLKDFSLHPEDLTLFFKRLRKSQSFRYFACGEYGDQNGRPHFHAIMFNFCIDDLRPVSLNSFGDPLYRSKYLESFWPFGFVSIGSVTFQSCSYVARYVVKKLKGKLAKTYDELHLYPPFVRMSRRPGIGRDFFFMHRSQLEDQLFCRSQGGAISPLPRYYENLLSDSAKFCLDLKKEENQFKKYTDINYFCPSPTRIYLDDYRANVLEVNKKAQITSLKRKL